MDTQEISLLALLLELIRDELLVIPFFLPVSVTVRSTFLDVVVGNRQEVKSELEVLLVLFRMQEVPTRAVDDASFQVPQADFALHFRMDIEQFTQFSVSSCFTSRDSLLKGLNCRC